MAIPPLILRIYADSTGVKKGVAQAQAQVGGLRGVVSRNAALMKAGFLAVGVGAAIGLKKAVDAAADLGEAQNKVNVIFGKSAGVVNELGKTAATSIGLANAEALSAAGAFGAMFDSAGLVQGASADMSVAMVRLAGDMASFNNEDPTEMLERLRSGLAGEAEPLRRFGVFISEARVQTEAYRMGLAKAGEELTDAQKIQARYNIILKDTEKQAGDFARTAGESLPNQIRILRAQFIDLAAKIGKVVIPVVTTILKWANQFVSVLQRSLGPAMKEIARIVSEVFGPAWEAVKPTLSAIATALDAIIARLREVISAWDQFIREITGAQPGVTEPLPGHVVAPGGGIQDIFPGRAHGGPVMAGRVYTVGERGPELFVPRVSGTIVPNADGGTPNVNVYIGEEKVEGVVVRALNKAGRR